MGFYKKTIILRNQQNYGSGIAILNIEQSGNGVFGSLKVFDIPKSNNLVLGISVDGDAILKQNVVFLNNNVFDFKLKNDFNINGKIGVVLADVENDVKALVWGTNGSFAQYKNDIISIISSKTNKISQNATMQIVEKEENMVSNDESVVVEKSKPELFEVTEEEIEQIIDNNLEEDDFFGLINDQLDELFDTYPAFEQLENLISNSRWVKVDYENNGKVYIIGLIYENSTVKYIAYGVPGQFDNEPPEDIKRFSQWLTINSENPEKEGYWVMYQDALTGESVDLEEDIS